MGPGIYNLVKISRINIVNDFDFFFINFYSAGKKPINLSVYSVQSTNIPPKETLTYSKQTQTNSSGGHERDGTYFCIFFFIY